MGRRGAQTGPGWARVSRRRARGTGRQRPASGAGGKAAKTEAQVKGPTPRRLWEYVTRRLGLQSYFRSPGDGRPQPQIPAKALLWSLLIGQVLRASSFLAVERLVRSSARRALAVSTSFGDDALDYFTERLDPTPTRAALAGVLHQAKRNKAFETSGGIGLAVGGNTPRRGARCTFFVFRPPPHAEEEVSGYLPHLVPPSLAG